MSAQGHCSAGFAVPYREGALPRWGCSTAGDAEPPGIPKNTMLAVLVAMSSWVCGTRRAQPWGCSTGWLHTERNQEPGRPGHSLDFSCPELSAGSSLKE